MNVHIVCARLDADRVLPRLARTLAEGTGWTLAEVPRGDAKLNYFFPYLELQKKRWDETKSAAWFTHKDTNAQPKADLWDNVAGRVDLRTLTAGVYREDLAVHGAVEMVRPAVERDRFIPIKKKRGRVVGISGWSYNDNRKGEDLIARLIKSDLGQTCEWRASGRGWPVKTVSYTWNDMPKFYQSLDLFVCASRIEGVPMPPLEVLSCGIPAIIPRGVGMLDDLPDIPGIYRFEKGSYDGLYRAFSRALNDEQFNIGMLRAITEPYCAKNWINDHRAAFEGLLYGTKPAESIILSTHKGKCGIYCVAFGEPSRNCAVRLIRSAKKYMPNVPVAFVGVSPLNVGEDIFIKQPDKDIGGRTAKLAVDKLAPKQWEYIIYLDADTEVMEPLDFILETLQGGWEFVICKDMHERHWLAKMRRGDNEAECDYTEDLVGTDRVMQYNGGMFAYRRNERTRRFFEIWNDEYQKWLGRDQGSLIRALHMQPLRMFVLMNQWNASDRYDLPPGKVAIMHHNVQARRWARPIRGRIDSEDAWAAVAEWEARYGNA